MPTISALIIAKNEEECIKDCIESILWVDEIIVLDSGSTDNTKDICKKYAPKLKLYETDWPGFGKQKNRAIKLATSEWLLFIDADEKVTSKLQEEILQKLPTSNYQGYKIPRQNYLFNKQLKYSCGRHENASIRLVKNGSCEFSDDVVHEKIFVKDNLDQLQNELSHFSVLNLNDLLDKINYYSNIGALKLEKNAARASFALAFFHASWVFIKIYFLRLGFLDGWPGFIMAFSNFEGTFYKYAKLVEKTINSKLKS